MIDKTGRFGSKAFISCVLRNKRGKCSIDKKFSGDCMHVHVRTCPWLINRSEKLKLLMSAKFQCLYRFTSKVVTWCVLCAHQCIHKYVVCHSMWTLVTQEWLIWLRSSLTVLISKSSSKLLMQGVHFHFFILHASSTHRFIAVYCMVCTHKHVV